jgi:hypothetical protein
LETKSRKNRDAADVFRIIWSSEDSKSSIDVAAELENSGVKNICGKILNDLSGSGSDEDCWDKRPLVENKKGSYKTTDYGDFFGYCLYHVYNVRAWMQSTVLGRDDSFKSELSPMADDSDFFSRATTPNSAEELIIISLEYIY